MALECLHDAAAPRFGQWGDKWVQAGPVVYQTESDGKRVELQLRKAGDDKQVGVADVIARLR